MKVWICNKCGCEVKDKQPSICPLCFRNDFSKSEISDPDIEEKKISKKYEEVIEQIEKYSEDCEPEKDRFSVED
ncbi:hypothetical protein CMO90_02685 [Candidatus Woesearchaeota archaeon]|jgi:RecJ-like exonuclease|nr:hypothetical protein [Candidatus Woesearchaeota archaeon]|tara:strand:- start:1580 stop:1801 length:222 start_codon:yes stop_codon:yes gene_type:complete